jgi:hypothetical protein
MTPLPGAMGEAKGAEAAAFSHSPSGLHFRSRETEQM